MPTNRQRGQSAAEPLPFQLALELISSHKQEGEDLLKKQPFTSAAYSSWTSRTEESIRKCFVSTESHINAFRSQSVDYVGFNVEGSDPQEDYANAVKGQLTILDGLIRSLHSDFQLQARLQIPTAATTSQAPLVFIGHGRSKLWARLKIFLEGDLKLRTICYESESRVGESIVPILEKMLNEATFAVLVFTAEDETKTNTLRARQNVVHEAGLFQGRLGFRKAVLLVQRGIEDFSNVDGLQYIPFTEERIEDTFYPLQQVLKRESQIKK